MRRIYFFKTGLFVLLLVSLAMNFHFLSQNPLDKDAVASKEIPDKIPEKNPAATTENSSVLPLRITDSYFRGPRTLEMDFSGEIGRDFVSENLTLSPTVEHLSCYPGQTSLTIYGDFQPGVLYTVTLKTATDELAAVVLGPDHPSSVKFLTSGRLFPLSNDYWELPLSAENIEGEMLVETFQAYPSLILDFLTDPLEYTYSRKISEKKIALADVRNTVQHIPVDLEELGIPRKPGLYTVTVKDSLNPYRAEHQPLFVTDLGITATTAGRDTIVAVHSFKDGSPVPDATVELYSRKRQLLSSGRSDQDGFCRLQYTELTDTQDYASFLLVTHGEDRSLCWAPCQTNAFYQDQAALFFERGVCRPGETICAFASLRDRNLVAKGGVPAEFTMRDATGCILSQTILTGDELGFYRLPLSIPEQGATGDYELSMGIPGGGKIYAREKFLVAEYLPDRIRLTLDCNAKNVFRNILLQGRADYYFGTPLPETPFRMTGEAAYVPFEPEEFPEFTFGAPETPIANRLFSAEWTSGKDGAFVQEFDGSPYVGCLSAPVSLSFQVSCLPQGGRVVSAGKTLLCHYADYYLGGCKTETPDGNCVIRLKGVSPDGKEVPLAGRSLHYELNRFSWEYVLRSDSSGRFERVWEHRKTMIRSGELNLQDGCLPFDDFIGHGEFRLCVQDEQNIPRLTMDFWHWGGDGGPHLRDPMALHFELDKPRYLPGETATVSFESGCDGQGFFLPGFHEMGTPLSFPVKAGQNRFSFQVPADLAYGNWFAYIAVASREDTASDPVLCAGYLSLALDQSAHRLKVALDAPREAKPGTEITISATLAEPDGTPIAGEVAIWGVDSGILALTGLNTPDLFREFFGPRESPLVTQENYHMLYPVLNAGTEKIGGGARTAKFLARQSERLASPAIVHLGILKTDGNGTVTASVRLPDFSGELTLFAVALTPERTGSAKAHLVVRKETTLEMTAPRAVAPGDVFRVTLDCFNHLLPEGEARWVLQAENAEFLDAYQGTFPIQTGGKVQASARLKAGPGEGQILLHAKFILGESECQAQSATLLRSSRPPVTHLQTDTLLPGEKRRYSLNRYDCLEMGSTALAITGSLQWLAEYPYGCLEQVTATAFPMLAVPALVQAGVLPEAYGIHAKNIIRQTIQELSSHRLWNGWLSMWPDGNRPWKDGSLFAFFFLLEAEKTGFDLPADWREDIVQILRETQNDSSPENLHRRVLANLLLATQAPQWSLAYTRLIPEQKADGFSKFLKAVTLVKCGEAADGMERLEKLLTTDFLEEPQEFTGFDSPARRYGMALWLLDDIAPEHPAYKRMAEKLLALRTPQGHWGTTQQNAWAALGLAKYCSRQKNGAFRARITQENCSAVQECTAATRWTKPGKYTVENTGESAITLFHWIREESSGPLPAPYGLKVHRKYLDMDGQPIDSLSCGQLVKVVLSFTVINPDAEEFVLCDMLPGGLEIEDDRLMTRAHNLTSSERQDDEMPLTRIEKRHDRFLAFGDARDFLLKKEYTYIYLARATIEGDFTVPPVSAESMYHPMFQANSAGVPERLSIR